MASNIPPRAPSAQQKYEDALIYKNAGNSLFKNNDIPNAIRKYHYALIHLRDIGQDKSAMLGSLFMGAQGQGQEDIAPELKAAADGLRCDCHNNLAACLLKQEEPNYEKVVTYCDNVIDLQPTNCKAYYRRGVALYNLSKYDDALDSLNLAKSHSLKPDSATVRYISLCKEKTKTQDDSLKQTYKTMMAKMSGDTGKDS